MSNKLTKGKRRYLLAICRHTAYLERTAAEREARMRAFASEVLDRKHGRNAWGF